MFKDCSRQSRQNGVAVAPLLVVIALFGVISMSIALTNRSVSQGVYESMCVTELVSQINLIRTKITKCTVEYPEGDNGTANNKPFPSGTNALVSNLVCPGNALNLWSGSDAIFLPRPPKGFNDWRYTNDATGVRISIQTTNGSIYGSCMSKASNRFNSSEVELSSNTLTVYVKK